ncbi:MAG: hypothetical protein KAX80_12895, partial [Planctomycetes bacterium]|nr:hypothetical protein [Planctomycetota bacterium]
RSRQRCVGGSVFSEPAGSAGSQAPASMQAARSCRSEAYASVALATDIRLSSPPIVGSALVQEGKVIHSSSFALNWVRPAPDRLVSRSV